MWAIVFLCPTVWNKRVPWSFSLCVLCFCAVERDKDFSHHRRHYREFRFDLTQIPEGEAVTAAEFRIYKDQSHVRFENITLKVTIYQVIKEYPNRWDLSSFYTGWNHYSQLMFLMIPFLKLLFLQNAKLNKMTQTAPANKTTLLAVILNSQGIPHNILIKMSGWVWSRWSKGKVNNNFFKSIYKASQNKLQEAGWERVKNLKY